MEYLNLAHPDTTNMFETLVGALNIAPIKISGQYKIVVTIDKKLYLDDYTGRRVAIDKSTPFLHQVANFLQVETNIEDNTILRYGGFQKNTQKFWHIPFYFNTEDQTKFPRYFVLALVPNETMKHVSTDVNGELVTPDSDLYQMKYPFKYGVIQEVIDLKEIGIHTIMEEIISEDYFSYPIYFNWEENNIKLFGYGIKEGYPIVYTYDLLNYMSNQSYLEVVNNKVLNLYKERKMFFPKFLNIEFDFTYNNEYNHFNNFMGYLAERVEYGPNNIVECSDQKFYIKIQEYNFRWKQVSYFNSYTLEKYLHLIADGTINEIREKNPQYRFRTYTVQANDYIKISLPNESDGYDTIFEYLVKPEDIDEVSLFKTWIKICYLCTKESGRNFVFLPEQEKTGLVSVTIINMFNDLVDEETIIELPSNFEVLDRFLDDYMLELEIAEKEFEEESGKESDEESDEESDGKKFNSKSIGNYFKFRAITPNDIWLCGQPNLTQNIKTLLIDNERYRIIEKFKFDDAVILRLDKPSGIKKLSRAYIFEDLYEEVIELKPINFLSYYSEVESTKQYDFDKYKEELRETFSKPNFVPNSDDSKEEQEQTKFEEQDRLDAFNKALDNFNYSHQEALFQYVEEIPVEEDKNSYDDVKIFELTDKSKLALQYCNEDTVKNMLFNSMGQTTYFTPDLFNIEKQCWDQNGCIDDSKGKSDSIRYNWFLIYGACPEYLKDQEASLRYMDISKDVENRNKVRPKITSRLIRVSDNICETIFLGVKYQLPIEWENYQFAVYLDFNNQKDKTLNYAFEVFPEEKLLMLSINLYLNFNDLLRGGNIHNMPLLDLSFFYNATDSANHTSEYQPSFKNIKLKLEPFYKHTETGDFRPLFNKTPQSQWRVTSGGKDYICIRILETEVNVKNLLSEIGNLEFYVYTTVKYKQKVTDSEEFDDGNIKEVEHEFTVVSMIYTFYNITSVEDDYFWCEDIKVKFFDNKSKFLRRLNSEIDLGKDYRDPSFEEILMIDESNIVTYEPFSDETTWGDWHQVTTVIVDNNYQTFELLLPNKVISLKQDYFEINQTITETVDGTKSYFKKVFKFPEFNIKGLDTDEKIIERFDREKGLAPDYKTTSKPEENYDRSVYEDMITLFERNQIWKIVQVMMYSDLKIKVDDVTLFDDNFTVQNLKDFSENSSIQIVEKTYQENADKHLFNKYIPLKVVDIDKNIVIWNISNQPKVSLINRIRTPYLPYLPLYKDFWEFQINDFKKYGTLWNLFDEQFGGYMLDNSPISATGLWQEVVGNIISTLFCKANDYNLQLKFQQDIDYKKLLIQTLTFEECIITNDNRKYIESLNKNLQTYIIENYAELLLEHFYYLHEVHNEFGARLKYKQDTKNKYLIHLEDKNKYGVTYLNFNDIILVLKRK